MNAPAKKPSPTLEDASDEELLDECEERGCLPEKDTGNFDDDEIRNEFEHRFGTYSVITLDQIYEEFRVRGDAPQLLRDYIYDHIGRILP